MKLSFMRSLAQVVKTLDVNAVSPDSNPWLQLSLQVPGSYRKKAPKVVNISIRKNESVLIC